MKATSKNETIENYKRAKENYLNNGTNENWKKFCDAKRECMLMGIRI